MCKFCECEFSTIPKIIIYLLILLFLLCSSSDDSQSESSLLQSSGIFQFDSDFLFTDFTGFFNINFPEDHFSFSSS